MSRERGLPQFLHRHLSALPVLLLLVILGDPQSVFAATQSPQPPTGDTVDLAGSVAWSKKQILVLMKPGTTDAVDCGTPSPKGEFEKTVDYEARLAEFQKSCDSQKQERRARIAEEERQRAALLDRQYVLPVLDVFAQYDADGEAFLLSPHGSDGYVRLEGAPADYRASFEGVAPTTLSPWLCRVPVSIADAPAIRSNSRLYLRFRFAKPPSPVPDDPLTLRDVEVLVGLAFKSDTPAYARPINVRLTDCVVPRPSSYAGVRFGLPRLWTVEEVKQVGGTFPRAVHQERVKYTEHAARQGITGTVAVDCVVLADGKVGDCGVVRSLDSTFGLDFEALRAARLWTFAPAVVNGEPVPVRVRMEFSFSEPPPPARTGFTLDRTLAFTRLTAQDKTALSRRGLDDVIARSMIARVDLDGDGVDELVVRVTKDLCDFNGWCHTWVYQKAGNTGAYREILLAKLPGALGITNETVRGYRALCVVEDGRIRLMDRPGSPDFGQQWVLFFGTQ